MLTQNILRGTKFMKPKKQIVFVGNEERLAKLKGNNKEKIKRFLIFFEDDKGLQPSNFIVVRAKNKLEVCEDILYQPKKYKRLLEQTVLFGFDSVYFKHLFSNRRPKVETFIPDGRKMLLRKARKNLEGKTTAVIYNSPTQILKAINKTKIDGDSQSQIRIYEIKDRNIL